MPPRIVTAREQYEMAEPFRREATPWHAQPGDPTYRVPTSDLLNHRQFNPAITTPQQMNRSLWTPSWGKGEAPYRNFSTPWSSGGSSEGSSEEDLVEGYERGDKFPPVEITTNGSHATLTDGNHRAEVADMLSHPDLESYINYDPHRYQDDALESPVDPNSALGKHIHQLVQNHPYEPVDGGPTTDHVFRRHPPQSGEWQRGKMVDWEPQFPNNNPGNFKQRHNDPDDMHFNVDWGNGPELTPERHLHARRVTARPKPTMIPIEVAKQYATFNTYEPEDDEPEGQPAEHMAPYEHTLKNEGWEGFGKSNWPDPGHDVNYPTLSVGKSGQHAVLDGHHRLWAADKLGLSHIPVEFIHDEDDDWAKNYGRPIEPHVQGLLNQHRTAGARGETPPLTFEPFDTSWSNGIMARHADDGRPVGHLHWHPDGEIDSITVHPDFQRMGIGSEMLKAAAADPKTYESTWPIHASNHMSAAGRAFAKSHGHDPGDDEVTKAADDTNDWGWTAVKQYVPGHVPYTGQNEAEMERYLTPGFPKTTGGGQQPVVARRRIGTTGAWPKKWKGRSRPDVDWDKTWSPNHPDHQGVPWDSSTV